jgi:hypothetical protein
MQHDDSVPWKLDVCPSCREKDDEIERLESIIDFNQVKADATIAGLEKELRDLLNARKETE